MKTLTALLYGIICLALFTGVFLLKEEPLVHLAIGTVHKDPGHTYMDVCYTTNPNLGNHLDLVFAAQLADGVIHRTSGQIIDPDDEPKLEHWTQLIVSWYAPIGCP